MVEAPRGGAGIEISERHNAEGTDPKPLVEGLVLKLRGLRHRQGRREAPRGGAGIEMRTVVYS